MAPPAGAQSENSIDDSVEDQDIFFDEIPDGGMGFIDELNSESDPDEIYSVKSKKKRTRKRGDVVDKGPKELKQSPTGPAKNLEPDSIFNQDPLFQVEKEQQIDSPQKKTSPAEVKKFGEANDEFQFPSAPGAGEVDFSTPKATGPTPPLPQEEDDLFGTPLPNTKPESLKDQRRRARTEKPSPVAKENLENLVFDQGKNLAPLASQNNWDDVDIVMKAARNKTIATPHPNAKKGLIRITQDRTYVYQVPRSKQDRAFSFKFGIFDPDQLENKDTGITFEQSYDSTSGPMISLEYEWQWWQGAFGKLGGKVGSGLFVTQGNGQFKNNFPENRDKTTPEERFTFMAFPNLVGVVYRAQFFDTQPLIPYGDAGLMAITFAELRDDQDAPKVGLGTAGFFTGGLALNLGLVDNLSILELDREYGINSIFLTGEFRQVVNLASDFNFESSVISGGLLMEF